MAGSESSSGGFCVGVGSIAAKRLYSIYTKDPKAILQTCLVLFITFTLIILQVLTEVEIVSLNHERQETPNASTPWFRSWNKHGSIRISRRINTAHPRHPRRTNPPRLDVDVLIKIPVLNHVSPD